MYASIQIPKPTDEQVLERAPIAFFREYLNDPNLNTYGRRGQGQQGVDLCGKRNGDPERFVGIQCKLKGADKELSEAVVREEVEKALTFSPALKEYFIITTAPDDAKLQQLARDLEVGIKTDTGRTMSIQVWGWDTLQREVQKYPEALKVFYPDYISQTDMLLEENRQMRSMIGNLNDLMIGGPQNGNWTSARPSLLVDGALSLVPLEQHIDKQIDSYREMANAGRPNDAHGLLVALEKQLETRCSGRLRFRIKANIAACLSGLARDGEAAELLLEACALALMSQKPKQT